MDRRSWLGVMAAGGMGLVTEVGCAEANHDDKKDAGGPLGHPHAHFCGIHMAKKNPKFQIITQHYCAAHSEGEHGDLFQCVLFDSTEKNAKLLGIEYIISDEMYRKLPEAEKQYWHAHTYEVLGGGLIAPQMTKEDESKFMHTILTTWGKAWHTWPNPKDPVPLGEPLLIWSLMGDGQADPAIVAERDKAFKCSTEKISEARIKEFGLELPNVSAPKSLDQIGRQWTDTGEDKPKKK